MNTLVYFVSDLHGKISRYEKLFDAIRRGLPGLVLLGGDLLPHPRISKHDDFLLEFFTPQLRDLQEELKDAYPQFGLILGNDDARMFEPSAFAGEEQGLWHYLHMKCISWNTYHLAGYSFVPPTPFLLKDWEKYDVSRYVDPGCIAPTEGKRTVAIDPDEAEYGTIARDIEQLTATMDLSASILLFHSPPYQSHLDRAALDGIKYEHVPLDVHVGSIAIKRFIEEKQPMATLHGHIHESSRITGQWKQQTGKTCSLSAAWDGEELALISFDASEPAEALRLLL